MTWCTRSRPAARLAAATLVALGAAAALASDSDGDGLADDLEAALGTSPTSADTDSDGWDDRRELFLEGTDPLLADSDSDGVADPSDTAPLSLPTGDPDGAATPTGAGAPAGNVEALSGDSPRDGLDVTLHDGGLTRTVAFARTEGTLPFELRLTYRSRSRWDGLQGLGWSSLLDVSWTELADGSFRVLSEDGVERTWAWNGSGWTPPLGSVDSLAADGAAFVRTSPTGSKWRYADGRLDWFEDGHGNRIDLVHDASGVCTSSVDARGRTHTFGYYTGTGRLRTVTAADGAVWTLRYDVRARLLAIDGPATATFPQGITVQFRYTTGVTTPALEGNLVAAFDGRGVASMRAEYDASDRVTRQVVGDGAVTFDHSYAASRHVTVTDRAGNERVWEWDAATLARTKLTQRTNRDVRTGEGDYVTAWTVDAAGYTTSVTWPRGNGVRWTLDAAKLPTERRRKASMALPDDDAADVVDRWTYDAAKNHGTTQHVDPRGGITDSTLDAKGRPTLVQFPALAHLPGAPRVSQAFEYDGASGRVTAFVDGAGRRTTYEYFADGPRRGLLYRQRVDDVAGGLALTTEYDWTDAGHLSRVVDPGVHVTDLTVERYGNVTKVVRSLGHETRYEHDAALNVVRERVKNVDWDGSWSGTPVSWWDTRFEYTATNHVDLVEETVDATTVRQTLVEYDANDLPRRLERGNTVVEVTYDERDLPWRRVTDPGAPPHIAATETFRFDPNGNLAEHLDARASATTHLYDGFDRRTRTTDPLGHYRTFVHDKAGNATEAARWDATPDPDAVLARRLVSFDAMGRLWKEEDLLLGTPDTWVARTYEHDGRGLVTRSVDRRGSATTSEYDGAGRLVRTTDAASNVTEWTRNACGDATRLREIERVAGSGATETNDTLFDHDALGRVVAQRVQDRFGVLPELVTAWGRDSRGVLRREVDPRGNVTMSEATAYRRLPQGLAFLLGGIDDEDFSDPLLRGIDDEDFSDPLLRGIDDEDFSDVLGRGKPDAGRHASLWGIDDEDFSDVLGRGRPAADWPATLWGIDDEDFSDVLGRGKPATAWPASLWGIDDEDFSDVLGRGKSATAWHPFAGGIEDEGHSDPLNRTFGIGPRVPSPAKVVLRTTRRTVDLGGGATLVTQWTHDAWGRTTATTDDLGRATLHAYDAAGRLTSTTHPDLTTTTYVRDGAGNATRITDPCGSVVDQTFDACGRLTARRVTRGSGVLGDVAEDFVRDAMGRIVEARDDDSVVLLVWDSLSRLVSETQGSNPLGTTGRTVGYVRDAEGALLSTAHPSGSQTHVTRDALGRATQVRDASQALIASIGHVGAGARRRSIVLANGTTTTLTEDGYRRPVSIVHATSGGASFAGFDFAFDAAGNLLYEERRHRSGTGDVFTWDAANRLVRVLRDCADPSAEIATPGSQSWITKAEYALDDAGNRSSRTITPWGGTATVTAYVVDALDAYTSVGGVTHLRTASGAVSDDGLSTFAYDAHGRLVEVRRRSDGALLAAYQWDALGAGRLTRRTDPLGSTRLVHAGDACIEESALGSGAIQREFAHGDGADDVLAMDAADVADVDADGNTSEVLRFQLHRTLRGSVATVTSPTQQVVEGYAYDEFGTPTVFDAAGLPVAASPIGNPWLFSGARHDAATGLTDLGGRAYAAVLGRSLQRSAAAAERGVNGYEGGRSQVIN